jgi:hypothetical protein
LFDKELLLRPNLNTKIVEHEEKLKKQELSSKARLKMEKDRADLNKQKSVTYIHISVFADEIGGRRHISSVCLFAF